MEVHIVTTSEAISLGLVDNIQIPNGHGAFGESEYTYQNIVYIDDNKVNIFNNDLILYKKEDNKKIIIQVISEYQSSNKLLSIFYPKIIEKRKNERYNQYLKLKKEFENS